MLWLMLLVGLISDMIFTLFTYLGDKVYDLIMLSLKLASRLVKLLTGGDDCGD